MKTAGLPSLLLLLSLLLIRTESNTTDPSPSTVPGPGGQSIPTTTPTTPNNNTTTDIGGDSNATSSVTQTGSTLNPKEDSPKTKPTDAATVTSAPGSTLETAPMTTPSANETGQIEGNDGQTENMTNSADLPDTTITSKPKETGPTTAGPKSSKAPNTTVAISGTPAPKPDVPMPKSSGDKEKLIVNNGSDKHKGPTTEPPKDKKMLWILLPVLGVLVAGVIFVLKKYTKGHGHTGTAENGTENASFQSRSESNKDGVMLLGVKTSEGEGNAAR
ncbi:mucin-5AC-like isoform X2 [Anguilla anguilla]|uniref:mucin-5AC-like isoform X2 n=1 Tax=Anguilla anguilla TaxID=7936 RepID=UPI0015A89660|nr:mucin-5AC-like isoform X2 [Anguilla anguilla]